MKKILFGVLCASACAAVASVEQVVSTIEVRAISSSLTNVVVAIPGLDLASGGEVAISNLIKTTNLEAGDMLVAFTNDKYEGWELKVIDECKVWVENDKLIMITLTGDEDGEGTSSDRKTLPVGSGIWLSRKASGTVNPFYVYALQPTTTNSTISAGVSAALVGNPTITDRAPSSIDGLVSGDQVQIPSDGSPIPWTYVSGRGWRSGGSFHQTLTNITAGTGFWYVPKDKNGRTIHW